MYKLIVVVVVGMLYFALHHCLLSSYFQLSRNVFFWEKKKKETIFILYFILPQITSCNSNPFLLGGDTKQKTNFGSFQTPLVLEWEGEIKCDFIFYFFYFYKGEMVLEKLVFPRSGFSPKYFVYLYPSLIYKNLKDLTKKDTHSPLFIIHSVLKCKALLRFPQ